ncbi:MAG: tetratricopeptide repeat protein [Candidatus Kapaibacterium sp.]
MKYFLKSSSFVTIFVVCFQLFGCGGADLQSAKLYRIQHNWDKANVMLEQAVKSDPTNDEAWALYVQNLFDLKRYEKIADLIDTARLYAIKNRTMVETVRHNTWVELYNGGLTAYNQNPDSKEQQQAAIGLLESAMKVAPDQPETYELLGDVYFSAQDTAKYIATYEDALKQVRSMHDQGIALGLIMHMEPSQVENAIGGKPSKDTTVFIGGSDSARVYNYRSNDGFFYFEKTAKPPHKWQLTGWRFTNTYEVGVQPMRISTNPYRQLANYYYTKGNKSLEQKDKAKAEEYFDQAVPLYVAIQRLDPSDENAATIIPEIYRKLDQPEKAKQQYEQQIAEHPSKNLYTAYGTVLLKTDDYEGAINSFQKALDIDPAYEIALFDIAAAYKNWAAAEQKKVQNAPPVTETKKDKKDKKAPQEQKPDSVRIRLEKSTENFEKVVAVDKKEFNSYSNLVENYDLLGKPDKSKEALASLEGLKNTDAAKDPGFWDALGKIYVRINRTDESAKAFQSTQS